jgi:hypothetical protein
MAHGQGPVRLGRMRRRQYAGHLGRRSLRSRCRQAQGMGGGSPPGVTVQGYDAESGVGALTKALADLPANGV